MFRVLDHFVSRGHLDCSLFIITKVNEGKSKMSFFEALEAMTLIKLLQQKRINLCVIFMLFKFDSIQCLAQCFGKIPRIFEMLRPHIIILFFSEVAFFH